jgi:hypothetical protein
MCASGALRAGWVGVPITTTTIMCACGCMHGCPRWCSAGWLQVIAIVITVHRCVCSAGWLQVISIVITVHRCVCAAGWLQVIAIVIAVCALLARCESVGVAIRGALLTGLKRFLAHADEHVCHWES